MKLKQKFSVCSSGWQWLIKFDESEFINLVHFQCIASAFPVLAALCGSCLITHNRLIVRGKQTNQLKNSDGVLKIGYIVYISKRGNLSLFDAPSRTAYRIINY